MRCIVWSGIRFEGPPEATRPGRAGATRTCTGRGGARGLSPSGGGDRARDPVTSASSRRTFLRRGRYRLKAIIAIRF